MRIETVWIVSAVFWATAAAVVFGVSIYYQKWLWIVLSGMYLFLYLPCQFMRFREIVKEKEGGD